MSKKPKGIKVDPYSIKAFLDSFSGMSEALKESAESFAKMAAAWKPYTPVMVGQNAKVDAKYMKKDGKINYTISIDAVAHDEYVKKEPTNRDFKNILNFIIKHHGKKPKPKKDGVAGTNWLNKKS